MAKRSAALARAEKGWAASRKRAANLGKKVKEAKPLEIVSTVGGGAAGGVLDANTPTFMLGWGLDYPSMAIGLLGVSYGLFTNRSGQTEKLITCASTGMLTGVAYDYAKKMTLEG